MKSWSEMNKEERDKAITELVTFDSVIERFAAKPHDIYRWMSVNKLPAWLIDGELKFHPVELEAWIKEIGGVDALKAKEAEQKKQDEATEKSAKTDKAQPAR
jgi:hypothetical protein